MQCGACAGQERARSAYRGKYLPVCRDNCKSPKVRGSEGYVLRGTCGVFWKFEHKKGAKSALFLCSIELKVSNLREASWSYGWRLLITLKRRKSDLAQRLEN